MAMIQQNPELYAQFQQQQQMEAEGQDQFDQIPEMADEESPQKDMSEGNMMEEGEGEGDDGEEQGFDQENNQIIGNLSPEQLAYIQQSQKNAQNMYNPLVQSVAAA